MILQIVSERWRKEKSRPKTANQYDSLYFVLHEGVRGTAAIFGYSQHEPYRGDLILSEIPITDRVGGGGRSLIFEFCTLCAAIDCTLRNPRVIAVPFGTWGRILPKDSFDDLVNGHLHPAYLTQIALGHRPWNEDIWDREYNGSDYTEGFTAARNLFRLVTKDHNISTNSDLRAYLEERVSQIDEQI